MARHGVQQVYAAGHIGGIKDAWLFHGLGTQRFRREVLSRVNFIWREDSFELLAVSKIHFAEGGSWRHGSRVPFRQAVERDHLHSAQEQNFRANTADIPRRARHQNVQRTIDRKSTRLNSSHGYISYAVFCLK